MSESREVSWVLNVPAINYNLWRQLILSVVHEHCIKNVLIEYTHKSIELQRLTIRSRVLGISILE